MTLEGLNEREVRDLFSLSPEEEAVLPLLREIILKAPIWEKFYHYLQRFERSREILRPFTEDPEKFQDLQRRERAHFESLFQHPFSQEFREKAEKAGHLHAQKGVRPSMFLGALNYLHALLSAEIIRFPDSKGPKCVMCRLLTKLLLYDASLILRAYFRLYSQRLEESLSELRSLNRIYSLLREINLLIFEERRSFPKLFEEACQILHKIGGFSLVWAGMEDPDSGEVIPIAAAGRTEYLKDLKLSRKMALAEGYEEELQQLFAGRPLIINDIQKDPRYAPRREKAIQYGFRSLMVLPIFVENEVRAFLFLYNEKPLFFTESELQLMQEISRDLSLAWMHIEKTRQLEKVLFTDELTGLGNERYFLETIEHEIEVARRRNFVLGVIRLDIDDFSLINHSLGYAAGDEVLKTLGRRLFQLGNHLGTVARTGPDDFALTCQLERESEIQGFLVRMREVLTKPVIFGDKTIKFSVSLGVALYPRDATSSEELLEAATIALKRAQREAPSGLAFYKEEETRSVLEKIQLLDELERAFLQKEFILYYQPRISIPHRNISGFEALIRWQHPEKGLIPPGHFISVLEDSGLIVDVGRWVIEEAARFLQRIHPRYPEIVVSFNVSVKQFKDNDLVTTLERVLRQTGIPARNFQMEVTERLLLETGPKAQEILEAVKRLGIKIAIDDFGTGFSSLVYLKRIPAESLKIDYSFVKGLPDDREDVEIVKAIVALAKNLGKETVAEGVETREQLAFLTGLGVDEVQGFYFARPLPEEETLKFLDSYHQESYFWK